MINKSNHIDPDGELQPTLEEQWEIGEALLRRHHPLPDVDEQWARLHINDEEHRPVYRYIVTAMVAMAACVAAFLIFQPMAQPTKSNGVPLAATRPGQKEIIISDRGTTHVVKGNLVSFATNRPQDVKADGPWVTMSTPRGKDCNLILPDGSKVWMNDETAICFPEYFGSENRKVSVVGEAYFEVVHDARHPFIVSNGSFTTTVLGTAFNVKAYPGQPASVTLVSGRVELNAQTTKMTLQPGQQAVMSRPNNTSKKFAVSMVNTYPYTQQKQGYFYFDNTPLLQIMIDLGRWYNKTIVFDDPRKENLRLHFVADRKSSLASIVNSLNEMDSINIEVGREAITVR